MGYWDIEDGADCVEKTWTLTKLSTAFGLMGASFVLVATHHDTAVLALQRAASTTVTMAGMGAIFGCATCLSTHIRDAPNDPLNYFFGGCATGIFLGSRIRSAAAGTSACLGLGTLSYFSKVGKKEGWRLLVPPKL